MENELVKKERLSFGWLIIKYLGIFTVGAVGYGALEVMWRGYTHYSMLLAGGLVLCGAYYINERHRVYSVFLRALTVTLLVLTVELIFGLVFNLILGLSVWDYSDKAFNFYGQICPLYAVFWLGISFLLCLASDLFEKDSD